MGQWVTMGQWVMMGQWVTMVTHDSSEMLMNCFCLRVSIAVSNLIIENSNGDYSSNMCSEKTNSSQL